MNPIDLMHLGKCIGLLQRLFGDSTETLNWLNAPHLFLGSVTPLDCLLHARGQEVVDILEGILSKSAS